MAVVATQTVTATKRRARDTTVGLKILMAVTGIIFFLFIVAHAYGNLKVFQGAEVFDGYSEHLRELGEPILPYNGFLWIMRVVLLASLVGHVYAAVTLWVRSRRARADQYAVHRRLVQTYSARTMRWGGVIILAFTIFHVLQFTTLTINVGDAAQADGPYGRMVASFQPEQWWVFAVYLIAVSLLATHLRHGLWSALQTLGASNRRRQRAINITAIAIAAIVWVGFMAGPFAILVGAVE